MSKLSKTARASMGQQAPKEVKVIPDSELLRLLRIDRASGIYPGTQGTDAALRTVDILTARVNELETGLAVLQKQYAEAQELAGHSATAIERLLFEKNEPINSLNNVPLKDQVTGKVEIVNAQGEVVATGDAIGLPYMNRPGDQDDAECGGVTTERPAGMSPSEFTL